MLFSEVFFLVGGEERGFGFGAFGCGLRSFGFFSGLKLFVDLEPLFWGEPCSFCGGVGGGLGGVFCGVVSSVGGFSDFLVGSSKLFFWRLWPGCAVLPAFP